MIRLIVFDLDDTLVKPTHRHEYLIAKRNDDVTNTLNISHEEAIEKIASLRSGGMTNYQLYESLGIEEAGVRGGDLLRERILNAPEQEESIKPDFELVGYLKALFSEGIRLAIVTDSPLEEQTGLDCTHAGSSSPVRKGGDSKRGQERAKSRG